MILPSALGVVLTATLLGVTHAIEPDHVAGISSLTGRYADARLSALAGACFSLGHVILVVTWLVVAATIVNHTSFGSTLDALGTVGAGTLLGILGAGLAYTGLRTVLYRHGHTQDDADDTDQSHSHDHVHVSLPGLDATDAHDHGVRRYLRIGTIGALFTLSPPLSMITFATAVFPNHGGDIVVLAVLAYGIGITGTMSLIGAGVGTVFRFTKASDTPVYGITQLVAGVLIIALATTMLWQNVGALL